MKKLMLWDRLNFRYFRRDFTKIAEGLETLKPHSLAIEVEPIDPEAGKVYLVGPKKDLERARQLDYVRGVASKVDYIST